MNQHSLAKTTPLSRQLIVNRVLHEGWSMAQAARAAGISCSLGYRWLRRFKAAGPAGLESRSSAPLHRPTTLDRGLVRQIGRLRSAGRTISYVAAKLGLVRSRVHRWVARLGLSKLPRVAEAVQRYEMDCPGELAHIDVKKLRGFDRAGRRFIDAGGRRQRGAPRQYLHVLVDGYSRYAYCEILPRENAEACCGFLERAAGHFADLGVRLQRILTDNASAYRGKRMAAECARLGIRHSFTRVRRPRTNGKAERFIRTALTEWGYLRYENSRLRDAALPAWLQHYNQSRRHSAIGYNTPASKL